MVRALDCESTGTRGCGFDLHSWNSIGVSWRWLWLGRVGHCVCRGHPPVWCDQLTPQPDCIGTPGSGLQHEDELRPGADAMRRILCPFNLYIHCKAHLNRYLYNIALYK